MYFLGRRERDVLCFLSVQEFTLEDVSGKDGQFGLYIGAAANFLPTGGSLEDKRIVTHYMGRKPVLN